MNYTKKLMLITIITLLPGQTALCWPSFNWNTLLQQGKNSCASSFKSICTYVKDNPKKSTAVALLFSIGTFLALRRVYQQYMGQSASDFQEQLPPVEVPVKEIIYRGQEEQQKLNQNLLDFPFGQRGECPDFVGAKSQCELQQLIADGAEVNTQNKRWQTPLILATDAYDDAAMNLLIYNKADVNHIDTYRKTALSYAIEKNNIEGAKILLKNNAEIGTAHLNSAIRNTNEEMIRLLLGYVKEVNAFVLLTAIRNVSINPAIISIIIEKAGKAINKTGLADQTPLMQAIITKEISSKTEPSDPERTLHLVRLLLANGADVNIQDSIGFNALNYALQKTKHLVNNDPFKRNEIVKELINAGIQVNEEAVEQSHILEDKALEDMVLDAFTKQNRFKRNKQLKNLKIS